MPRNELRYLRGLTGRLVGLIVGLTGNLAAENAMELLRDKKKKNKNNEEVYISDIEVV